ncbi:MAG: AI-2E family transporter, partial [Caldilineae bacterium]
MNGSQTQPESQTPAEEQPSALPVRIESAGPNFDASGFDASGRWDPATKRMVVLVLLVAGGILFWISRPVLPLLVIAWILSYILSPVVDTCERLHIPRSLSTIVLYLLFLVVLILVPILVAPILIRQLRDLFIDVPTVTLNFINYLQTTVANLPTTVEILGFHFNVEGLVGQLQSSVTGG